MTQIRWGGKWVHLAYIWIVSHLSAKNYRNLWKFDKVLTKTNLLSFFWDTVYIGPTYYKVYCMKIAKKEISATDGVLLSFTDSRLLGQIWKGTGMSRCSEYTGLRRLRRIPPIFSSADWDNSTADQKISVCLCVNQGVVKTVLPPSECE